MFNLTKKERTELLTFLEKSIDKAPIVIAICAALFTLAVLWIKFCVYMKALGLFMKFDIDLAFYDVASGGFIFDGIKGVVVLLAIVSSIYLFYKMLYAKEIVDNPLKGFWVCLCIVIVDVIASLMLGYVDLLLILVTTVILFSIEWILAKLCCADKCLKKSNSPTLVVAMAIIIIVCALFNFFVGYCFNNKEITTINNEMVVLYTASDYYIAAPYDVINNKVIIYKRNYEKIDSNVLVSKESYEGGIEIRDSLKK